MKTRLLIILALFANFAYSQQNDFNKRIVDEVNRFGIIEASFSIPEIIEIYKKDTLIIQRTFNEKAFDRTEYTKFCFSVCVENFRKEILKHKNEINKEIIEKILSEISNIKTETKPVINWSEVFKTCQTCPFGAYPDERFFYFRFSIIFMTTTEIKQMIDYENGQQWKYALMAIKGGDSFILSEEDNYIQYILDRRIATFAVEKWKDSEVLEIKNLISTYRSVL